MTITNITSDGLHSQMIVLARTLARTGPLGRDELIASCGPVAIPSEKEPDPAKLRAALSRWLEMSLFGEDGEKIELKLSPNRGESLDAFTDRLPPHCRAIVLRPENSLPLWPADGRRTDEGTGRAADFVRSVAWLLAQDIYSLPTSWAEIQQLESSQYQNRNFIILNASRWSGLRYWARYLGFGTGEEGKFFVDPTVAVRHELTYILKQGESVDANTFIDALAARLPVLDRGEYRSMVEADILAKVQRTLAPRHLSMSLSFALRRLELDGTLALDKKADVGEGAALSLTGRGYRTWAQFTHVRLQGEQA